MSTVDLNAISKDALTEEEAAATVKVLNVMIDVSGGKTTIEMQMAILNNNLKLIKAAYEATKKTDVWWLSSK